MHDDQPGATVSGEGIEPIVTSFYCFRLSACLLASFFCFCFWLLFLFFLLPRTNEVTFLLWSSSPLPHLARFLSLDSNDDTTTTGTRRAGRSASSADAAGALNQRRGERFRVQDWATTPAEAASKPLLVVAVERDNAVARLQAMVQGRTTVTSGARRAGAGRPPALAAATWGVPSSDGDAFHFEGPPHRKRATSSAGGVHVSADGATATLLGVVCSSTVAGAARDLEFFFDELYGQHRFHSVDDYSDQMD